MDQCHGKVIFDIKMHSIWKDIRGPYPVILIVHQNTGHTEVIGKSRRPYDYDILA